VGVDESRRDGAAAAARADAGIAPMEAAAAAEPKNCRRDSRVMGLLRFYGACAEPGSDYPGTSREVEKARRGSSRA